MTTEKTYKEEPDTWEPFPAWHGDAGQTIVADSSTNGGGLRIVRADGSVAVHGLEAVAAAIGEKHPAVVMSRAMEERAQRAQRTGGYLLQQIEADARRAWPVVTREERARRRCAR